MSHRSKNGYASYDREDIWQRRSRFLLKSTFFTLRFSSLVKKSWSIIFGWLKIFYCVFQSKILTRSMCVMRTKFLRNLWYFSVMMRDLRNERTESPVSIRKNFPSLRHLVDINNTRIRMKYPSVYKPVCLITIWLPFFNKSLTEICQFPFWVYFLEMSFSIVTLYQSQKENFHTPLKIALLF